MGQKQLLTVQLVNTSKNVDNKLDAKHVSTIVKGRRNVSIGIK